MESTYTFALYLKDRLEEIGLQQMFGVAGNYTAGLLDTIIEDADSPIKISGNANEICAGFSADAYARLRGVSALYVTYSVGAYTLLNTIAGSFVEQVPVILINGAPTNKEDSIEKNAGLLFSHTTGYQLVDIHMFRPITAAAERITNAEQGTYQVDAALTALLTQRKPIYLEVTEDVWRACCRKPGTKLMSGEKSIVTVPETDAAAKATVELMRSNPKSVFWAGVELQRFGLQDKFLKLLDTINSHHTESKENIKFVTSAMSKSVISECHEWFGGCVTLKKEEIAKLVGTDGVLVGLGAWTTGKDTGNQDIRSSHTVLAAHGGVFVGAEYYPSVSLEDYIDALDKAFATCASQDKRLKLAALSLTEMLTIPPEPTSQLGYDSFYKALGDWLTEDDVLVVDAGFPLIGAQGVPIKARNGFIAQAAWLAIGYSVPAGTGVSCACPDKRAVVVVGDGAFHETCQAVADQHAYGQNTVVFVLANGIYGIEQYLVNPNPFRKPPLDYSDKLLDKVYPYNDLPQWKFSKLTDAFGGIGRKVDNLDELESVMAEIRANTESNFLVEITIPETDTPKAIADEAKSKVGEDEIANPNWPPAAIF